MRKIRDFFIVAAFYFLGVISVIDTKKYEEADNLALFLMCICVVLVVVFEMLIDNKDGRNS